MKLTDQDKDRLKELLSVDAKEFTPEQKEEFETLKAAAEADGIELETLKQGDTEVSEEKLAEIITKAVGDAVSQNGMDSSNVVEALKEVIAEKGKNSLTADKVQEVIKEHIGGNAESQKALVASVTAAIPKDYITEGQLAKAFEKFASTVKADSKMVHPEPYQMEYPIAHRSGNLSVAEKQLLNICSAKVSHERKEEMRAKGQEVPTSMNDGITADQLRHAQVAGANKIKSARNSAMRGKAITTAGVGSGFELIPSDLSSELLTRLYLDSQIAAEFVAGEIDMPTDNFTFPLTTTRTQFYVGSEAPGSDPTSSEPGTDDVTLSAKKLIGVSEYSYEADEDSIIAVLPLMLSNLSMGAADALEGALINGDNAGTHQDSDVGAGNHAKLFNGFRKYAQGGSLTSTLSGGITAANIAGMRKQMGKYGIRPQDLMLVTGPQGYNDLVQLEETLTFEKVGNQAAARILTGEAGSIYGIRIVVSSQVREDLNAGGVHDGVTTDNGTVLLVHKPSWIMGVRRGFTVEVDTDIKRQINCVVASFRRSFMPMEVPSLTIPSVVAGVGYTA